MALSDTLQSLGKGKIAIMLAAAILMTGFFIAIAFKMTNANMAPLYTNLSLQDSSRIVAELEKTGVPYEIVGGGTQIMVPVDKALRLRMSMAEQGIPAGGTIVGYEIFDRTETFGSSNFVMNVNMARALEGELARTIASLAGVENARVHLVLPKRELFSRDRAEPSASVTIKMGGGASLQRSEVTAITHIIAASVPGLNSSRVTVVDSHGRLLARGDGNDSLEAAASSAQEHRIAYENRMERTIEDLLEKVVGPGKVRVQVTADMNFDRIVTNSEKYDPEGQVARSTQSNSQRETSQEAAAGGGVSAANNLPGNAATAGGGGNNRTVEQSDEMTNYEISKTVQNHISEGGKVNKIFVAALVDGVYTKDAEDNETYAPRSEEEMQKLQSLIATAIGYDENRGDKIELANMRFTDTESAIDDGSFFEQFKLEMHSIIQTLIMAIVAVLAILLVLRPAVNQLIRSATSPSERVAGDLAALEAPGETGAAPQGRLPGGGAPQGARPAGGQPEATVDVANVSGGVRSSSMQQINQIVQQYPDETLGVVRQWVAR